MHTLAQADVRDPEPLSAPDAAWLRRVAEFRRAVALAAAERGLPPDPLP